MRLRADAQIIYSSLMPAVLSTDGKLIALCVAAFAAGVSLFAAGLVVDPTRLLHHH